jgi:hypothetical protein
MTAPIVNCPDCSVPMEIGCLPEVAHQGITGWTTYLPGIPPEQRFLGLFKTGGIVVDWKKVIPVTVFRCPDCGLLKAYAVPPPVAATAPAAKVKEPNDSGDDEDRYRLGDA